MGENYIGKTCPYCKTPMVEGDIVVVCNVCNMPHHLSCWQENQGCTTFGCTGTIKEVIENRPAAAKQTSMQATGEQSEKPIELLSETREMVFLSNVPLSLENTALIIDRTKDKLFARCTFRCLADKEIKAVLIEITCQDVWGNTVGEPTTFQYLDLKTKRDSKFGQTSPIELTDKTTRNISVSVKKVLFADGVVASGGNVSFTMSAPELLSDYLGSEDLAAEYARETVSKAKFVLKETDAYWLCTCGALNTKEEENCHNCQCTKEQLIAALDVEVLTANMQHAAAVKRIVEEKRAKQIRQAEEDALREQERQQERLRLQQEEEQGRKRRKVIFGVVAGLAAILLIAVFWLVPYIMYQNACMDLEAGRYKAAYQTFVDLGDFMDSENMATKTLYEEGKAAIRNNQFDAAIKIFKSLGDYKDSKDQIKEAQYLKADAYQKEEKYKEAYQLFSELGNYKESQDEVKATILLWEAAALGSASSEKVEEFVSVVRLQNDEYEIFYTTLLLYINAHKEASYWCNANGGATTSKNVQRMLSLLPNSYKDTATLKELYALLASGRVADIFEDHMSAVQKCWSLLFIRDLATHDDAINYFLRGYWSGSGYYIKFYENENGGTNTTYTLPHVEEPSGTKYYTIEDMIYYYDGGNSNHLAKVYRFEIVDFNTIEVYCYKNNRTYTLYR